MASKDEMKSMQIQRIEHDEEASAKRVVAVAEKTGRTIGYEDASFVSGNSPVVLDIATDLGREGRDGYIVNDGTGNILAEISDDGTNYGSQHTLKEIEILDLAGLAINTIRLTHVADSAYRVLVV